MINFKSFNLKPWIQNKLDELNFTEPTPIQQATIPAISKNKYVIINSSTGSGKTLSFLLPVLNRLNDKIEGIQTIIITPSRELGKQLFEVLNSLIENNDKINARLLVGGENLSNKSFSKTNIVVGTASKIRTLFTNDTSINITNAKEIIIDEADMSIDYGFFQDINFLLQKINKDLSIIICSATIPVELHKFMQKYTHNKFKLIKIEKPLSNIEHIVINSSKVDRLATLSRLTQVLNPYVGIIFASEKKTVNKVHEYLSAQGLKSAIIHGDMSSRERKQMLKRIRNMEFQWIVASDVLSRGLDIDGLNIVISFNLPNNIEFYQHRSGRTARYYSQGQSYILLDSKSSEENKKLNKLDIDYKVMKVNNENELVDVQELKNSRKAMISNSRKKEVPKDTFDNQITQIKNRMSNAKSKNKKPNYKRKMKEQITKLKRKQKQKNDKKKRRMRNGKK